MEVGEVCDLGTVLARHSLLAWVIDYEKPLHGSALDQIEVALDVSHDAEHWVQLGSASVSDTYDTQWPNPIQGSHGRGETAWPARYVRARVQRWPEKVTGLVSATVASA